MAGSRVTIPQLFFDIVSPMFLTQPTPEFLFAKLAIAAQTRAALMKTDAERVMRATRAGGVAASGGALSLEDHQLAIASSIFAQAITAVEDASKAGTGETIRIPRPVFSGGNYTESARTIAQSQTISTTPIDIGAEQVSITVKRVGGPRSSSGTEVQPYAIDRFAVNRGVDSLVSYFGEQLVYDRTKYLDSIFSLHCNSASTSIVRPQGVTADASFPSSGEVGMDLDTLLRAEEKLQTANVRRFADGTYLAIVSPVQMRQLMLDPDFLKASAPHKEVNPLFNTGVRMVGTSIRVVSCTTIQTDSSTVSGQTIQRGVMMAPGAVGFGVADTARVVDSTDDNYGEVAKVCWIAYEGSAVLDERMLCSMRSI